MQKSELFRPREHAQVCPRLPWGEERANILLLACCNQEDFLTWGAIYSDGVTEATNANQDEFGDERFAEVLKAHRQKSATEIVGAVNQALTDFVAGSPAADDITLVVARRVLRTSGPARLGA